MKTDTPRNPVNHIEITIGLDDRIPEGSGDKCGMAQVKKPKKNIDIHLTYARTRAYHVTMTCRI